MYMTGPDKATPLGPVFEMNIVCFVLNVFACIDVYRYMWWSIVF